MQTLLVKCAALAVIVGGFACTGDVARLAARFTRLLNATTVPADEQPPLEDALQPVSPATPPEYSPTTPATQRDQATERHAFDAPLGRRVEIPAPPAVSAEFLDLASLRPGDRVMLWIGRTGTGGSFLAFDVVDPAVGEVLTAQAVPRRMRLLAGSAGSVRIGKGQMVSLAPIGIVHGTKTTGPTEIFGPVQAMHVRP
jgi:hypothetical protein